MRERYSRRTQLTRRLRAASLCALALGIAGCGGSSSSSSGSSSQSTTSTPAPSASSTGAPPGTAYLQQFASAAKPWQAAGLRFQTDYQQAVNNRDQAALSSSVTAFKSANDGFSRAVSGLTPPTTAKSQQDAVISDLKQLSGDLDQVKTAIDHTNGPALASATAQVKNQTQTLLLAVRSLGLAVRRSGAAGGATGATGPTGAK